MELQAAFISIAVSLVGTLGGWVIWSVRNRNLERQRALVREQLEIKRQEEVQEHRKFLEKQVDRAIENADDARRQATAAVKDAANWKTMVDDLQAKLTQANNDAQFAKRQVDELSLEVLDHKTLLKQMPELKAMVDEQGRLINILTSQLERIPQLESEVERLHTAADELNRNLGALQQERSELAKLLEAERKIHRLNEEHLKSEINTLNSQLQSLTEENRTLKLRIAALENRNLSTNNHEVEKENANETPL